MFDIFDNRLKAVEHDINCKIGAPTLPIYDPDNLPQDAINGQIALGTDGSINWYLDNAWSNFTGTPSIVGNIPQDVIDGQIVIGSDDSLNWLVDGTWYGSSPQELSGGNPPQDAIDCQLALSSTISTVVWFSNEAWFSLNA